MNTQKTIYGSITDMVRTEINLFGANYGLEFQAGQLAAHVTIIVNKALECAYAAGISHANLVNLYANEDHETNAEEDEDEAVNIGMTVEEVEEIENSIVNSYAEAIDDLVDTDATDDYDEF